MNVEERQCSRCDTIEDEFHCLIECTSCVKKGDYFVCHLELDQVCLLMRAGLC